jgi:hypothetical protein
MNLGGSGAGPLDRHRRPQEKREAIQLEKFVAIITKCHKASSVMTMHLRGSMQGSLSFADSTYRATRRCSDFVGAGLYACFFRDQLIYVGKYLGTRNAWQQGNVIAMRWVKHIGSFTMRARHLGFSDASYKAIIAYCRQKTTLGASEICEGFLSADPAVMVRETGCMATYRRFLVGVRIRSEIGGEPSLDDFSFLYAQVQASCTTFEWRKRISAAEADLLQRIHPEGNTIANPLPPTRLSHAAVSQLLEAALGGSYTVTTAPVPPARRSTEPAPRFTSMEPEDTGAEGRFLDRIDAAPVAVQDFIRRLTEIVADSPNAEVNYTDTPDLRIRSYGAEGMSFRNVVTIQWQPQEGRLLMRSLLPESELTAYGLSLSRIGTRVLTNETFLTVDLLQSQADEIINAVLRAHELARGRTP